MFALVDCNNFYASCEKLFRPDLKNRPVVVLSNNDGCIVARSAEAKLFDIPMAAPFYKYKDYLESRGTACFSSNYALYGDISNRVMEVLSGFAPVLEQYSIDEAFLDLSGIRNAITQEWAENIVRKVKKWVGIDVSVGVAPSKTLAKIANHQAKKKCENSVCVLADDSAVESVLEDLELTGIWGISRNLSRRLNRYSIWNALELKNAELFFLRKNLGIMVERTARELRGEVCFDIDVFTKRKNIQVSRSFAEVTADYQILAEAASAYAAKAAEKLRAGKLLASGIYLYIRTSRHTQGEYFSAGLASGFLVPTSSTFDIIAEAKKLLEKVYRPEYLYQKVGVMLLDLVGESRHEQQDMFGITEKIASKKNLLGIMDKINKEFGSGSIKIGAEGIKQSRWKMRSEFLSPKYTTDWQGLPRVR